MTTEKGWPNWRLMQVEQGKARIEGLEAQVERLLERALVAEAAEEQLILLGNELSKAYRLADERARRAVARETALVEAGRTLSRSAVAQGKEPAFALDPQDLAEFDSVTENVSPTAAALLERLAKLEAQAEDLRGELEQALSREAALVKVLDAFETNILYAAELRGALRAALTPLEAAADALVPPGAMAGLAAGLVDEALAAVREELE